MTLIKRPVIARSNHAVIELPHDEEAIIDLDRMNECARHNWWLEGGKRRQYVVTWIATAKPQRVKLHRFLTGWPNVDHRNGDTLDNRLSNLRPATVSQQNTNKGPYNGRQYKGVYPHGNKWRARLRYQGTIYELGLHDTQEEAAKAWDRKAIELHGEFKHTNFRYRRGEKIS